MTTNPFPTVVALEKVELDLASEEQFLIAAEELKLSDFAKQVARNTIDCPTAIEIIGAVAPVRALGQAALRYQSSMGPLADYLIEATKHWAIELGSTHGPECLPTSTLSFGEALQQEAKLMASPAKEPVKKPHHEDPLIAFRQVLAEMDSPYSERRNGLLVKMLFGPVGCECIVSRTDGAVSLFFYSPIYVPMNRRGEVAEALVWANWQSPFGAFEMDHPDGQVRFHYSLPLIGEFAKEHARMMLSVANAAMHRYIGAICTLALTDYDPQGVMIRAKERDEEEQKLLNELTQEAAA